MKNKNITIIGGLEFIGTSVTPDNNYSYRDIIDNIRLANIDPRLRDLYLRFLYTEVQQWNSAQELPMNKANKLELLEDYLQNNHKYADNYTYDADKFSLLFTNKLIYLPYFSNIESDNIIGNGLNIIRTHMHLCSEHTALMLPYIANCIKDLENPVLICDTDFLYGCTGTSTYKISDDFHIALRKKCSDLGILYCEYTGNIANLI